MAQYTIQLARRIGIKIFFHLWRGNYRTYALPLALMLIFSLPPAFLPASERENLDRAIQALKDNKIPYEERPLSTESGSLGSSLLVRKSGTKQPGTFVFAVPLYAEFAVDTALAMSETQRDDIPASIIIAFLGDEDDYAGLRDLLTLNDMPEDWVLCYFDAPERPGGLHIRHGRRGYVAPLDIIKPLPGLFKSGGIPWAFRVRFNEIYKLEQVEGPEALAIAYRDEINSFVLSSDLKYAGPGEKLSSQNLAELLLDYAGFLNFPVLNADRHYFSIALPGGASLFISQGQTAALTFIMTGLFMFLFLAYSVKHDVSLLFHIRLFLKRIWIFLLLLPLLVFSIKFSGLIYSRLLSALNASTEAANYAGAGLTLALAVLIFFLPSPALDLVHFPRRSQFYAFSAAMFVSLGLFVAALLDFSYIRLFLWASVFVFLGALTSEPVLVFICMAMVPLFPLGALINIFEIGSGLIAESFTSAEWKTPSSWAVAFHTAVFFLPLFLLGKRGIILIQKSRLQGLEKKPIRKYRLIAIPILMAVVLAAMVIQISLMKR